MPSRMRHGLIISLVVISLSVISSNTSYSDTTNYIYDELNRLIRVEYGDGAKIIYTYDQAGNRSHVYVGKYTLAVNVVGDGTVTKNPDQPIYSAGTSVTLTAVDGVKTFSEWSGDLTGNTNPTNIVMDGNKSVTATFVTPQNWLQGWTYRKPVTLSRASGAVTNYQMRLLVGETAGASGENVDCNGHVRADFNDLRFTTAGGTVLDYWIESITGTTPNQLATVWIEFDSIGTDATTFYMYYGKADASAVSNIKTTFVIGDDFNDGSIDTSIWADYTANGGTGSKSETGGAFVITPNSQTGWANYGVKKVLSTELTNFEIFAKIKSVSTGTVGNKRGIFCLTDSGGAFYSHNLGKDTSAAAFRGVYNGTDGNIIVEAYTSNTYVVYRTRKGGTTMTFWLDGTQKWFGTSRITGLKTLTLNTAVNTNPETVPVTSFDYIFVRNYNSPEPAWGSWGAEEAN